MPFVLSLRMGRRKAAGHPPAYSLRVLSKGERPVISGERIEGVIEGVGEVALNISAAEL